MGRLILAASALCTDSSLFAQTKPPTSAPSKAVAEVPFVGCKSSGQMGPVDAPIGNEKSVPIAPEAARRLSYYQTERGIGVLAPRGWHCFGTYGSNGEALYVSPEPIHGADLFSTRGAGFAGPLIQISHEYGDTSGRFSVARTIARVFPAHKAFVTRVIEEKIEPADSFPFGPYAKDRLTYKSNEIVEYETPVRTDGLGTMSRLRKNSYPISGVAMLTGKTPDLLFLAIRLPSNLAELAPLIIQQTERNQGN